MSGNCNRHGERGTAIVGTLGIVLILSLISLGTMSVVINDTARCRRRESVSQAFYIAMGAMDRFLVRTQQDPSLYSSPPSEITAGTIGNDMHFQF